MKHSITNLLDGIIDYAGLFPPASLSLEDALVEYSSHQTDPIKWMLSRFICPASKLCNIIVGPEGLDPEFGPYKFSVLLGGEEVSDQFNRGIDSALQAIDAFALAFHGQAYTDVLEVKIASALVEKIEPAAILTSLAEPLSLMPKTSDKPGITAYYELDLRAADVETREKLQREFVEEISKHNESLTETNSNYKGAGYKLRTGGTSADLFPSIHDVAQSITVCRDNQVPFKATAGLHHPLRHFNNTLNTSMHGFLNVFGGGVLAAANGLTSETLEEILAEEDSANFSFENNSFSWKNIAASVEEIKTARAQLMRSFGSCSFIEPRDDLAQLGLISL